MYVVTLESFGAVSNKDESVQTRWPPWLGIGDPWAYARQTGLRVQMIALYEHMSKILETSRCPTAGNRKLTDKIFTYLCTM